MRRIIYTIRQETKFNVYVAKFAFQVRGEYDEAGNLTLPKNYYDNIDHETIVANIKIEAFPTVDFLLGTMSEKEIVIFCGNGWGTLAYRAFNKAGMSCVLIDSDDKVGDMIDDKVVVSAKEFLANADKEREYCIVAAGANVHDIVRQVNHSGIKAKLYWLAGAAYRKFLGRK